MIYHIMLGGIILLAGVILKFFPPKSQNWFYGYRSRRSMRSRESWNAANRYAANLFIYFGLVVLVLGIFTYYVGLSNLIPIFGGLGLILLTVILTENYLSKNSSGG